MKFEFVGSEFQIDVWTPQRGVIGEIIAFDTETTLIEEGKIPLYVIGQAYAGDDTIYIILLEHLAKFMKVHCEKTFVMHTAAFDTSVVTNETKFDFDLMIRSQRLFDISIEYRLLKLAKDGHAPDKYNLKLMCEEVLGITLNKSDDVRLNFGQYRVENKINFAAIPEDKITYAAKDSVATLFLFQKIHAEVKLLSPYHFLSHKISLMGDIALNQISQNGFGVDLSMQTKILRRTEKRIAFYEKVLAGFGHVPGQKGIQKKTEEIVCSLGVVLPRTKTGKLSLKEDHLSPHRVKHRFVDVLLKYKEYKKQKDFVTALGKPKIHTRYQSIKDTGRVSSSSPNLQNIPRQGQIRSIFIPAPGHIFVIADYSQIELCTLAQICIDRFGYSRMAELINEGMDLHKWFASQLTGKTYDEIGDSSVERQWAKAGNFGFPGGLGIKAFLEYAKKAYGLSLTESDAENMRARWLSTFPEMKKYLADTLLDQHDFSSLSWCKDPEIGAGLFKRIVRGERYSTGGNLYKPETIKWAFNTVMADIAPDFVGATCGSHELLEEILKETIMTRTGRIRTNVDYCAARNNPFQGLAADGAKIALYRLCRAGFHLLNFVHDEIIAQVLLGHDVKAKSAEIQKIMISGMAAVVPDVTIKVKVVIADRWQK